MLHLVGSGVLFQLILSDKSQCRGNRLVEIIRFVRTILINAPVEEIITGLLRRLQSSYLFAVVDLGGFDFLTIGWIKGYSELRVVITRHLSGILILKQRVVQGNLVLGFIGSYNAAGYFQF